MFYCLNKGLE